MREYFPADYADDAEECSKLHYFAEKDRLFKIKAVLLFWGFICVNLRDLRETLGFRLCILIEYSHVNILPQMAQITQRNAASCIISQRKTGCLRLRLFCCLGFYLRKSARSAGDFGVFIECSYVFIFPQITQITQTNAASCIISQRKTGWGWL